jgi:putative ABC transport system ATP-binding protein
MSLLELERVTKRYRRGRLEVAAVREVSLDVHPGELIAIWGLEGSGRSTLLRIAAGIEAPDEGQVRFQRRCLRVGESAIPGGIAYCQSRFRGIGGEEVLEELIGAQLALGVKAAGARARASQALERVNAYVCGDRRPFELDRADAVRVSVARALVQQPGLLIIDEPTKGVDLLKRDGILELLRSLSREGLAVLMSAQKGTGVFGADRVLALSDGELRGHAAPEMAQVVELPLRLSG